MAGIPAIFFMATLIKSTLCILLVLLSGCMTDVRQQFDATALNAGMKRVLIAEPGFTITSYQRVTDWNIPLRVYIEGDGYAWVDKFRPSLDPTPRYALGLSLALRDHYPNVIYLARPCQFSLEQSPSCQTSLWTSNRFSEQVVTVMNNAIDQMISQHPSSKIELIGYSGGAAVAVLIATRRSNILNLRTIAGNLDHDTVNRFHHVDLMPESLNPVHFTGAISLLPQIHFVGKNDQIVPLSIAQTFNDKVGRCSKVIEVENVTHQDGWLDAWSTLVNRLPEC